MKIFGFIGLLVLFVACGKQTEPIPEITSNEAVTYDSVLAEKYGADQYGMKQYVIAFLTRGPNRESDSVKAMELQRAHMANIGKMAASGKLVLAGPFLDDTDLRGLYFFNVETIEEARALTETDPAIQSGHLAMELRPWYGSAAMMGINEVHSKLSKEDI